MNFPSAGADLLARYERASATSPAPAWAALIESLHRLPAQEWLVCAQQLVLRGGVDRAAELLECAHERFADSAELAFALAGVQTSRRKHARAEALLREVLERQPAHAAAALRLADVLREQAKIAAAAAVLRSAFAAQRQPADVIIRALEWLDEVERPADAAAIAEAEIGAGSADPRLHAYAATYLMQIGEFVRARERYLFAYAHSPQAPEWDVPFGLASTQRYRNSEHADFALFEQCLARAELTARARTTLLFGMGKAYADIDATARAVEYFSRANEQARALWPWSRKQWRRGIDARMQAPRLPSRRGTRAFQPIFLIGVPRSGTTLAAELIARHPHVCNRGESRWIWTLSQRVAAAAKVDDALLEALANEYEKQMRQDDAEDVHCFIDKQPLNLLHVGFILALFPDAKIVYCKRHARDTALSLWMQFFREPSYAFAYDFADIAALQQGCERIMAHWCKQFPDAIRTLQYEELANDPQASVAELNTWIGLPQAEMTPARAAAISTASVWQARQPVYTSSIGRWRAYAANLPELAQFPDR